MERLVLELLNALDALDATLRDVRTEFLAIDSPPFLAGQKHHTEGETEKPCTYKIPDFPAAVNETHISNHKGGKRVEIAGVPRKSGSASGRCTSKKMNVDQAAVSKWESGENGISRKYHKKLAKLYGVTVDELLSDQNEG